MFDSMPRTASAQNIGIGHYGFVLARQWYVVAVATLLGVLVASGYLLAAPATSTATTDVQLDVIATNAFSSSRPPQSLLDPATESEIVHSAEVAARAARSLNDAQTPEALRAGLETTTSSNGQVVHLSYTAPTKAQAEAGADALAASYLAYRGQRAETEITGMLTRIGKDLAVLQKQLGEARAAIDAAEAANRDTVLARTSRDVVTKGIDRLVSERTDLTQVDTAGGVILNRAATNPVTASPNPTLTLAGGLLAGLVLGMIVAFPVNKLDRRFRNGREVERALGVPPLASLAARTSEFPETNTEALHTLAAVRERVLARLEPPASLAVVDDSSARDEFGLPCTLALAFAEAGIPVRVVLFDVDDHARELLGNRLGLITTPRTNAATGFRSALHPGLEFHLLPPGPETAGGVASNLPELVNSTPEAGLTLLAVRSTAPDATLVAALRLSDGLVVALATHSSTSTRLFALLREATAVGTPFLGTLVTPKHRRMRRLQQAALAGPVPVADAS
jgi:capsular polysaccharide biosynthesis protein